MNNILKTKSSVLIAGLFVVYFLFVVFSKMIFSSVSIDLTQEKIHTMSNGTKNILSSLKKPIDIDVYYSKEFSQLSTQYKMFYDRLKTTLNSYKEIANSNLNIKFHDVEPYSKIEDEAMVNGLKSVQVQEFQGQLFFGLVAKSEDGREEIPFFDISKESFLEYDLSLILYKLSNQDNNKIGVVTSSFDFRNTLMAKTLKDFFDVVWIEKDSYKIDKSIKTLLVTRLESLSKKNLFAIDQFVLNGGNLLVFTDPLYEKNKNELIENKDLALKLLKNWGVKYDYDNIAIDMRNSVVVRGSMAGRIISINHPAWLELNQDSMSKKNIMTTNIKKISLASSGILEPLDKNTTFVPLLNTSDIALKESKQLFYRLDFNVLKSMNRTGDKTFALGAHISKKDVKSAFKKGLVVDKKRIVKKSIKKSKKPINVVVIADSDILSDERWARAGNFLGQQVISQIADNARLVSNIIENLAGGSNFISLRGRGFVKREFVLLKEIKLQAEQKYLRKEAELRSKLRALQAKLNQAVKQGDDKTKLTKKQQELSQEAQSEMVKVRASLRKVQHELKKDIQFAQNVIRWINILLMPSLILLFGFLLNKYFQRRRKELIS